MDAGEDRIWRDEGVDAASAGSWARRLRGGDGEAVRHVRERVKKILGYQRLRIPQHDQDDLEQEIMAEVWRAVNRPGFDFAAGFWGFVEVVAARRYIDWLRARKPSCPLQDGLPDGAASPLQRVLSRERVNLVTEILGALDPACRRLISLRLEQGLSYREAAVVLGSTEGALRVQMYRCIRSAQRILGRRGADGRSRRTGRGSHEAP